jgi:nucleoside-diphosphate-sugar epimerase
VEGLAVTDSGPPGRILLTGATGFIGSHVARRLVGEGHDVTAIVRPGANRWRLADIEPALSIVEGDLAGFSGMVSRIRPRRPDICIHLAWQGWSGKAEAEANLSSLGISLEVLRMMGDLSCRRFVSAGTCFEYRLTADRLTETTPLQPHDLYGACKKSLFEVAQPFSALTGISVVTPRIFYSYGPYEDERRLVPSIAQALLRGEAANVTPGEQVRDYLHVEDIAAAICAVARSEVTGAVNIASDVPMTIAEVATRIGRLLDRSDLINLGALKYREGEPMHIVGDSTILRTKVGWSPAFTIDSGLSQTIDWWRQRIHCD